MASHSHSPVPAGHLPGIPTHSSASSPTLRCCCGRPECTFLAHNHQALEGLEKDLETAARLGQALLHRHESYMVEAEEDRQRLHSNIDQLERQKRQVEEENVRIIEENRGLLEQLEGLNKNIADSDAHSKSLTATLETTEAELRKVTATAARAADLEAQLSEMETEQSKLQDNLQTAQNDNKSAVQRWKKAESTLQSLQDQVEKMEKETRDEQERHSEMVQRMERRRVVERELDGAAGRLKGAAAAQELGRNPNGTNVVSRFVRDILQDNANLQMGIMELREMLDSSNLEVQNLRDQVLTHQPLDTTEGQEGRAPQSTTLSQELESSEARRISQEYHIHHHYHSSSVSAGSKRERVFGRSKKRRSLLGSPIILHSASGTPLSRKSLHNHNPSASSNSTVHSQASVPLPTGAASRRWSSQSPAIDSLSSSPQSGYRPASIFDRVDRGFESSRPTSPDSTVFSSPYLGNRHRKSDVSVLPGLAPEGFDQPANDELLNLDYSHFAEQYDAEFGDGVPVQPAIPEESEEVSSKCAEPECGLHPAANDDVFASPYSASSARKSPSHDDLFSVAGMDIHTPSNRPSRMSLLHPTIPVRFPRKIASPSVDMSSTVPVFSSNTAMADGENGQKIPERSPRSYLASVSVVRTNPEADSSSTENEPIESTTPTRKVSLGRRVGSWMRGRWGASSEEPDDNTKSQPQRISPVPKTPDSPVTSAPISFRPHSAGAAQNNSKADSASGLVFRYPGVNQNGPIKGFHPRSRAPSAIHAEGLDEDLLRESLAE
ncbi:hypothetical protein ASPWEDRAFT_42354 [Aspergillus wentii DTO 134E9]|uniref:Uncharacterized protein n=1 Tax=Aspergillus wentii DTO 134E9 TaxID=1073089 RepID=A0A1L9RHI5_ASPWE|nr:uncharacterized protein ASPWEDRAFT_42354 [Aspergillus wentii DTO 134E9]KAI9925699.1 hypothetical protein MW887_005501 [Aspergillus wentii]OJJ34364.1 hypothetical protein ASPWEDRAFT_42354 [Aspergillus wentii DTO 134E9]